MAPDYFIENVGDALQRLGHVFTQLGRLIPVAEHSSTTITPIRGLYRHGGWVPVIAGMFPFGCGVRLLDDALDVRANPYATFLILFLFPNLVMSEQDWITLLAAIAAFVLLWLLIVAITFRRQPGGSGAGRPRLSEP